MESSFTRNSQGFQNEIFLNMFGCLNVATKEIEGNLVGRDKHNLNYEIGILLDIEMLVVACSVYQLVYWCLAE